MNNTMTRRIFRSTLLVGVVVLLAALALVLGVLYSYFGRVQESQLRDELSLAAVGVTQSGEDYLRQLKSDQYRITWVAADGSVLFDTQADASAMENHAQRQEVRQALAYGEGESSRYSSTLLQKTVYYAKLLPDGTVLRLSSVRVTAGVLMLNMLQPLLLLVIAVLILSGVLAGRLAKRITEPLNRLDLENPLENDTYEELAPLLRRMEHQRRQIDRQMDELKQRAEEFQQITGSMNEGLVLLDENGAILSINPAAQRLLGTDNACVGQDILTVDRDVSLSDGLRTAAQEGHSEFRGRRGGREYQFDISRIQTEGRTAGTVLLVFDVTERAFAEQNRREFTANVSHELKTPMTTIAGFADGILDGTIPPEKERESLQVISSETRRLSRLVRRMLELSRLQSSERVSAQEQFDAAELLIRVLVSLEAKITEKDLDVETELPDGPVMVWGDPDAVTQVCYNLLDVNGDGVLTVDDILLTAFDVCYMGCGASKTIYFEEGRYDLTEDTIPVDDYQPARINMG